MLYKKDGGSGWRGRMLGFGTIASTIQIENSMDKIIKLQNIIKDNKNAKSRIKQQASKVIEIIEDAKNSVRGATIYLEADHKDREYEQIIPLLKKTIESVENINPLLESMYGKANQLERDGERLLQQAKDKEAYFKDYAKGELLKLKSIIDAAKESYTILTKKSFQLLKN